MQKQLPQPKSNFLLNLERIQVDYQNAVPFTSINQDISALISKHFWEEDHLDYSRFIDSYLGEQQILDVDFRTHVLILFQRQTSAEEHNQLMTKLSSKELSKADRVAVDYLSGKSRQESPALQELETLGKSDPQFSPITDALYACRHIPRLFPLTLSLDLQTEGYYFLKTVASTLKEIGFPLPQQLPKEAPLKSLLKGLLTPVPCAELIPVQKACPLEQVSISDLSTVFCCVQTLAQEDLLHSVHADEQDFPWNAIVSRLLSNLISQEASEATVKQLYKSYQELEQTYRKTFIQQYPSSTPPPTFLSYEEMIPTCQKRARTLNAQLKERQALQLKHLSTCISEIKNKESLWANQLSKKSTQALCYSFCRSKVALNKRDIVLAFRHLVSQACPETPEMAYSVFFVAMRHLEHNSGGTHQIFTTFEQESPFDPEDPTGLKRLSLEYYGLFNKGPTPAIQALSTVKASDPNFDRIVTLLLSDLNPVSIQEGKMTLAVALQTAILRSIQDKKLSAVAEYHFWYLVNDPSDRTPLQEISVPEFRSLHLNNPGLFQRLASPPPQTDNTELVSYTVQLSRAVTTGITELCACLNRLPLPKLSLEELRYITKRLGLDRQSFRHRFQALTTCRMDSQKYHDAFRKIGARAQLLLLFKEFGAPIQEDIFWLYTQTIPNIGTTDKLSYFNTHFFKAFSLLLRDTGIYLEEPSKHEKNRFGTLIFNLKANNYALFQSVRYGEEENILTTLTLATRRLPASHRNALSVPLIAEQLIANYLDCFSHDDEHTRVLVDWIKEHFKTRYPHITLTLNPISSYAIQSTAQRDRVADSFQKAIGELLAIHERLRKGELVTLDITKTMDKYFFKNGAFDIEFYAKFIVTELPKHFSDVINRYFSIHIYMTKLSIPQQRALYNAICYQRSLLATTVSDDSELFDMDTFMLDFLFIQYAEISQSPLRFCSTLSRTHPLFSITSMIFSTLSVTDAIKKLPPLHPDLSAAVSEALETTDISQHQGDKQLYVRRLFLGDKSKVNPNTIISLLQEFYICSSSELLLTLLEQDCPDYPYKEELALAIRFRAAHTQSEKQDLVDLSKNNIQNTAFLLQILELDIRSIQANTEACSSPNNRVIIQKIQDLLSLSVGFPVLSTLSEIYCIQFFDLNGQPFMHNWEINAVILTALRYNGIRMANSSTLPQIMQQLIPTNSSSGIRSLCSFGQLEAAFCAIRVIVTHTPQLESAVNCPNYNWTEFSKQLMHSAIRSLSHPQTSLSSSLFTFLEQLQALEFDFLCRENRGLSQESIADRVQSVYSDPTLKSSLSDTQKCNLSLALLAKLSHSRRFASHQTTSSVNSTLLISHVHSLFNEAGSTETGINLSAFIQTVFRFDLNEFLSEYSRPIPKLELDLFKFILLDAVIKHAPEDWSDYIRNTMFKEIPDLSLGESIVFDLLLLDRMDPQSLDSTQELATLDQSHPDFEFVFRALLCFRRDTALGLPLSDDLKAAGQDYIHKHHFSPELLAHYCFLFSATTASFDALSKDNVGRSREEYHSVISLLKAAPAQLSHHLTHYTGIDKKAELALKNVVLAAKSLREIETVLRDYGSDSLRSLDQEVLLFFIGINQHIARDIANALSGPDLRRAKKRLETFIHQCLTFYDAGVTLVAAILADLYLFSATSAESTSIEIMRRIKPTLLKDFSLPMTDSFPTKKKTSPLSHLSSPINGQVCRLAHVEIQPQLAALYLEALVDAQLRQSSKTLSKQFRFDTAAFSLFLNAIMRGSNDQLIQALERRLQSIYDNIEGLTSSKKLSSVEECLHQAKEFHKSQVQPFLDELKADHFIDSGARKYVKRQLRFRAIPIDHPLLQNKIRTWAATNPEQFKDFLSEEDYKYLSSQVIVQAKEPEPSRHDSHTSRSKRKKTAQETGNSHGTHSDSSSTGTSDRSENRSPSPVRTPTPEPVGKQPSPEERLGMIQDIMKKPPSFQRFKEILSLFSEDLEAQISLSKYIQDLIKVFLKLEPKFWVNMLGHIDSLRPGLDAELWVISDSIPKEHLKAFIESERFSSSKKEGFIQALAHNKRSLVRAFLTDAALLASFTSEELMAHIPAARKLTDPSPLYDALLSKKSEESQTLASQLQAAETRAKAAEDSLSTLQTTLSTKEAALAAATSKAQSTEADNSTLSAEIKRLTNELAALETAPTKASDSQEVLKAQSTALRSTVSILQALSENESEDTLSLSDCIQNLRSNVQQLLVLGTSVGRQFFNLTREITDLLAIFPESEPAPRLPQLRSLLHSSTVILLLHSQNPKAQSQYLSSLPASVQQVLNTEPRSQFLVDMMISFTFNWNRMLISDNK